MVELVPRLPGILSGFGRHGNGVVCFSVKFDEEIVWVVDSSRWSIIRRHRIVGADWLTRFKRQRRDQKARLADHVVLSFIREDHLYRPPAGPQRLFKIRFVKRHDPVLDGVHLVDSRHDVDWVDPHDLHVKRLPVHPVVHQYWVVPRAEQPGHVAKNALFLIPCGPHLVNRLTSDQFQTSPAASPEILHHTVWKIWLFIAYSDERWLYYQFSLPHSQIYLQRLGKCTLWTWEWKDQEDWPEERVQNNAVELG